MHSVLGLWKPENGKHSLDSLDTTTHCFIHITGHTMSSDLKVQCNRMDITLFWILRSDFQITKKEQRWIGIICLLFSLSFLIFLSFLCLKNFYYLISSLRGGDGKGHQKEDSSLNTYKIQNLFALDELQGFS